LRLLRGLGFLISTVVLYLTIPLVGWGLDDLQGFFSLYQRWGYALLIFAFGFAVGYQAIHSPEGIRGGKGQTGKLIARQSIVRVVAVLLLYGAVLFLPFADRRNIGVMLDSSTVRWIGLILVGLGCGLIYWSGITLGRLYSAEVTIQQNHHLVTNGTYRLVRHPRYLGAILRGFG
jgi:protein-S-isoprenylcysteine O-methyltransferase Ste14